MGKKSLILLVVIVCIFSSFVFSRVLDFEDSLNMPKKLTKSKEEEFVRLIKTNNLKELYKFQGALKDLNKVDDLELMTPVQLALNYSNYEVVSYFKENNLTLGASSLGKLKGQFLRYGNPSILKEISSLGYPVVYNTENIDKEPIPNTPWISNLLVSYFLYNPFQTFSESYMNLASFEKRMGSKNFYALLENYITAYQNTDFSWEIRPGNKNFYNNFNFVDEVLDNKGFTRVGGTSIHYNADVYNEDEKKDATLWKLSKFFHRRGEIFGNLFAYYSFKYLDENKNENLYAKRLWNKYSFHLKTSYNEFAKNWNKGVVPLYPYDKYKGKKNNWDNVVQLPLHLDGKFLKLVKNKLPILEVASSSENKMDVSSETITLFETVEKEIGEKIALISPKTSKKDIEQLIVLINTSSFKYNSFVWNELLLKLTSLPNKNPELIDFIIPKIADAKTISVNSFYTKIQLMIDKGLIEETIKFYNHLKLNGYLRYNIKFDELIKEKLGNGVNITKALYGDSVEYSKLPENHTYRRFLLQEDYLKLKFSEEEITIALDKEELEKIFLKLKDFVEKDNSKFVIQNLIPPEVLLAKKPTSIDNATYKKILLMYSDYLLKSNERVFSAKSFLEKIILFDKNDVKVYERLVKATEMALVLNADRNTELQLEQYKKELNRLKKGY